MVPNEPNEPDGLSVFRKVQEADEILRQARAIAGLVFRHIREALKISQDGLAKKLDVTANYVSAIEQGKTTAGIPVIVKIIELYDKERKGGEHGSKTGDK